MHIKLLAMQCHWKCHKCHIAPENLMPEREHEPNK